MTSDTTTSVWDLMMRRQNNLAQLVRNLRACALTIAWVAFVAAALVLAFGRPPSPEAPGVASATLVLCAVGVAAGLQARRYRKELTEITTFIAEATASRPK